MEDQVGRRHLLGLHLNTAAEESLEQAIPLFWSLCGSKESPVPHPCKCLSVLVHGLAEKEWVVLTAACSVLET